MDWGQISLPLPRSSSHAGLSSPKSAGLHRRPIPHSHAGEEREGGLL